MFRRKKNQQVTYEKVSIEQLHEYSKEISSVSKLKFDNAIIKIPDVKETYSFKLIRPVFDMNELTDEFIKSTEKFFDKKIDTNELKFKYLNGQEEPIELSVSDLPEYNSNFVMLSRYDNETNDDVYFQPFSLYWCATKYSAYEKDVHLGEFNKLLFFDSNDFKDTSCSEFADNLIKDIQQDYSYFLNSESISISPYRYYQNGDRYYILLQMNYNNIPINTDYFYSISDDGETEFSSDTGTFGELVADKNQVYRIVGQGNFEIELIDTYTELLSPVDACQLVSNEISDDINFDVTRFELLYNYEQIIDENDKTRFYYECRPYWKIAIENTGIPEYPMLAFMVDAVSGKVKTYKIG